MTLFFALCFVGVAWRVQCLRDLLAADPGARARPPSGARRALRQRHFLKPDALAWLLRRDYRQQPDRSLSGLATPAWVSLLTLLAGLGMAALLWLASLW